MIELTIIMIVIIDILVFCFILVTTLQRSLSFYDLKGMAALVKFRFLCDYLYYGEAYDTIISESFSFSEVNDKMMPLHLGLKDVSKRFIICNFIHLKVNYDETTLTYV
jgi:hypothetical protein